MPGGMVVEVLVVGGIGFLGYASTSFAFVSVSDFIHAQLGYKYVKVKVMLR